MKKQKYTTPMMEVVIAYCEQQLLAGSLMGNGVLDEQAEESALGLAPDMALDSYFE